MRRRRRNLSDQAREIRVSPVSQGTRAVLLCLHISPGPWTIGTRRSQTRSRRGAKSFCSRAPGWGDVPTTVSGMAAYALAFVDPLGLKQVDLFGFSLGGMVTQTIVLERSSLVRKMMLVGTAPEGGEDIMHLEKPEIEEIFEFNPPAAERLKRLFFAASASSQAAGAALRSASRIANPSRTPRSRSLRLPPSARGKRSPASASASYGTSLSHASWWLCQSDLRSCAAAAARPDLSGH